MIEIYGIAGRKGHGKDTFARLIVEADKRFVVVHFADALKQMLMDIFNIPEGWLFDPGLKEVPFYRPIEMDHYLPEMRVATGLDLEPAEKIATTPRELMQFFGTDYVRKVQQDYWTHKLISKIEQYKYSKVLVPDTRFPNEAQAIQEAGGKIIKIVKTDAPISVGGHASEDDSITPDLLVGVKTGDISLLGFAADMVVRGCFRSSCSE